MSQERQVIHRKTVRAWLSNRFEWRIPVYQRHYAWDPAKDFGPIGIFGNIVEKKAERRLAGKDVDPHYFGAIIVDEKRSTFDSADQLVSRYDVVDGQQRLTTINIALFALIDVASQFGLREPTQAKLAEYTINNFGTGPDQSKSKLVPTNFDRARFCNLFSAAFDKPADYKSRHPKEKKSNVVAALHHFQGRFKTFVGGRVNQHSDSAEIVIDALVKAIVDDFELIMIPLEKTDKAQKVFESLNNTSERLNTFDLIRNDVFYREAKKGYPGSDEKLFNSEEWQQFEDPFWEEHTGKRSDTPPFIEAYIARMLTAKIKSDFSFSRETIFEKYKCFARRGQNDGWDIRSEIRAISEYVDVYKYLVGERADNPHDGLDFGYFMYKTCRSMDFYPVIFVIATCDASVDEKKRMISLLESYVIRRYIAGLTSQGYNKQVPPICDKLDDNPSYSSLKQYLTENDGDTRKFPTNNEIISACLRNDFYSGKDAKQYIFARIIACTTDKGDEKRDLDGLTIDHIMPKAWSEKSGWKKLADDFSEDLINSKINTIGNLTPMSRGRNSRKSNQDWEAAKEILKDCDLKMTRELAKKPKWELKDIDERSEELARVICKIWPLDFE